MSSKRLSHRVRRKLDNLEQSYTLHRSVDALKKYVREIEGFCEAEIDGNSRTTIPVKKQGVICQR